MNRHICCHPNLYRPSMDNFIYFDKSFGGWVIGGEEPFGPYFISHSSEYLECPEFVESWDSEFPYYEDWEPKPKIVGGKLKCESEL